MRTVLSRLDTGRVALLLLLAVGAAAFVTRDQWDWLLEDGSVQTEGVDAPTLEDVDDATERLYRIGEGSSVTYTVEERLAGASSSASGTTPAIAGDIALNTEDLTASRIGTIVVNVEMFESDSNLRDRRIRHDYLESTHYPFAEFVPRSIDGLDSAALDGAPHDISIVGDLTVKETTAEVVVDGTVTVDDEELRATVATVVSMSAFDVGPINIAGLVHTGDEVRLDFVLVASRVAPDSAGSGPAEFVEGPLEPGGGAFATTVQPILERNCVACHGENGPGFSTVALATAGDAAAIADDIALVTGAGYMPPWPANDAGLEFAHDRRLSDADLAAIREWAGAGGGLDVAPDTVMRADTAILREIDADTTVQAEPYAGSTDAPDDYRCQVYEIGDPDEERWIRGLQFIPDRTDVVHHAVMFHVRADQRANAEAADAADDGPGWTCFGMAGVGGSTQIAAWAPGAPALEFPAGAGVRLAPGDFVVIQIHYHYDHEAPLDHSSLAVDLIDDAELAAAGGTLDPVRTALYLAPAELPCSDEQDGPLCDRDTVLAQILEDYGPSGFTIPDGLLARCGRSLESFMADTDGVATSTCDTRVSNPGRVIRLWPHMHEFGASYRMILNPGTEEETLLVEIPTWSFEWQLDYAPLEDLVLEPGDVIRVECTWDRSLVHEDEPRYVTWNVGTGDEMCYSTISTIPVS